MISLKIATPAVPFNIGPSIVARVRARFMQEAGALIVDSVRSILGQSSIYSLSPEYAARKPRMKGFRRVAGKSADQPLILSGQGIYDNIDVVADGDGFIVHVDDRVGESPDGFDYAEYWESGEGSKSGFTGVDYLGKGLDLVEDKLADLMGDIIVQEMGL